MFVLLEVKTTSHNGEAPEEAVMTMKVVVSVLF
jgi:hypothetical protein